jgi:RNA polymerase sigma-70 factor (ECF subfamily)
VIFVQRYWYFCSIDEIAENLGIGQSRVKMSLLRSRSKLRQLLEKEGVAV